MTPTLQIKDLSLKIGARVILDRINLSIHAGEIMGLVGRSGSGKSMTGLAAMRLAPENASIQGDIILEDENLATASEKHLCSIRGRDIAMVFQEPMTALNPLHSIGMQIAETILIHSDTSKATALRQAGNLLTRVGLPPETISPARLPHELSGGQRQRVVIAIAIAMKPKILIADEPTTSLDVTTQTEILALLKDLAHQDNMGLLLITHDLAIISEMADQIALMKDGRIVEQATPQMFFNGVASSDVKELLVQPVTRTMRARPSKDDTKPVLKASNIVCAYPLPRASLFAPKRHLRAVDGVSLTIRKNENVGLVGESGCGKSTFARTLLGLAVLSDGNIEIDGAAFPSPNAATTHNLRRKIQIVFQDPYSSFNPRQTIRKVIAEPLNLLDARPDKKTERRMVTDALSAVDLSPDDAEKYPHAFSGGQRQRIAIARALITEPEVIILDEATSALDTASRNRVLELLMRLSEEKGVSYLFITHDLSVVRSVTDRLLVMKTGRIVEEGATHDIFEAPKHPYTQKLLNAAPVMKQFEPASP
ncbi:MAG: ABC transporter ATP-binding protein [Pseudomonadota bacterium]